MRGPLLSLRCVLRDGASHLLRMRDTVRGAKTYLILRSDPAQAERVSKDALPVVRSVRDPTHGADLGEFAAQLGPIVAGVVAAEQFAVVAARDDQVGIGA